MVLHTADAESLHLILAGYASQEGPDSFLDIGPHIMMFPILCAENDMIMQRGVSVGHSFFPSYQCYEGVSLGLKPRLELFRVISLLAGISRYRVLSLR